MSFNKRLISTEAPFENAFNVVTYSGNSSTQSITGVGFKPDLVWIRERGPNAENSNLYDSTRGVRYFLTTNSNAQSILGGTGRLTSYDTDGFTVGNDNEINDSPSTYVAWCWRANEGTTSSNTDGTITSTVQANPAAGFSIVKWTGTGSAGTVGHSLSSAPEMVITKRLSGTSDWYTYHKDLNSGTNPAYNFIKLNSDAAEIVNASSNGSIWNSTSPSSTVINIGTSLSGNGDEYIAYAFHSVSGYSKIGSYTGTGSSGNAQSIGFQPDFVMIKSKAQYNWNMYDTKRPSGSITGRYMLLANATDAEYTTSAVHIDITSTGFSFPNGYDGTNKSSQEYIYMAFKIVS